MCHREVVARGLVAILSEDPERFSVVRLPSITSSVAAVDVVIYDLALARDGPDGHLADLTRRLGGRVVGIANGADTVSAARASALGLSSCLTLESRASDVMLGVVRAAAGVRLAPAVSAPLLSEREREILVLIFAGLSNAEIAAKLVVSPNTLKSHIRSAYRKVGAQSRAQAVAWCALHGVEPDAPLVTTDG